jgi:hypothetical protein
MGSFKVWLFRVLLLVAAGLMLLSWLQVWWRADIQEAAMYVNIRPWGLEHTLGSYIQYLGSDPSLPAFFAPLMWAYLGICLVLLLVSMFIKDIPVKLGKLGSILPKWLMGLPLPQWLIGGVGVSYVVFVITCALVAYIRVSEFDMALIGETYLVIGHFELGTLAISGFQWGFWLACAVGPLLIVLGLLRGKIIGRPALKA